MVLDGTWQAAARTGGQASTQNKARSVECRFSAVSAVTCSFWSFKYFQACSERFAIAITAPHAQEHVAQSLLAT